MASTRRSRDQDFPEQAGIGAPAKGVIPCCSIEFSDCTDYTGVQMPMLDAMLSQRASNNTLRKT